MVEGEEGANPRHQTGIADASPQKKRNAGAAVFVLSHTPESPPMPAAPCRRSSRPSATALGPDPAPTLRRTRAAATRGAGLAGRGPGGGRQRRPQRRRRAPPSPQRAVRRARSFSAPTLGSLPRSSWARPTCNSSRDAISSAPSIFRDRPGGLGGSQGDWEGRGRGGLFLLMRTPDRSMRSDLC